MGFVQGEGRTQGTLFPVTLEELIPEDHVCRVIDAFVNRLDMAGLGFERAEAAETGRPGYDPRDLLKLFLYGYLQRIRSSRRLENECRRNIELMWLLGRLVPDHKTVAEFRRMHSEALTQTGAELIRFARSVGLVRGEWVAIDGSKFRAASSVGSVRERDALQRYLEEMESADAEEEVVIDPSAVAQALEKLRQHPEPEAHFMRMGLGKLPAYNVQAAVDSGQTLKRKQLSRKDRAVYYVGRPEVCGTCALKLRCTVGAQRLVSRNLHDEALQRMQQRATPEAMRLRRSTVEHPFATLKYHIFGHPRFLLRGRKGAQTEMSLAVIVYNLKRMMNVLGRCRLSAALAVA